MAVVNFFQIIHASRFYYKTRYIKFGEISKRNTLFNKNPTATELTFLQKYIFLPVDVILILVDHLFDILVILMYRVYCEILRTLLSYFIIEDAGEI